MFAVEMMRAYAACILFALFFLGGWQLPFEDTLVGLPFVGGLFEMLATATPGIAILLAKAYLMFAFFVWVRASLHRIRTDQILEFGWRWLLPASIVNLAVAILLRLEVWNSTAAGGWPIWAAPVLFGAFIVAFIVLAIDEDEEALELNRRMYHTQTLEKASPGTHRE
jgi:hypothetical protein